MDRQFYPEHGWHFRRVVVDGEDVIEGSGWCPVCSSEISVTLTAKQPSVEARCPAAGHVRLTIDLPVPPDLLT